MNKLIVIGHLGRDPEMKYTPILSARNGQNNQGDTTPDEAPADALADLPF